MSLNKETVRMMLEFHCPRYQELPKLDLYMDQMLSITEEILSPFADEEKGLTSHMVNNYVKQKLISAPVNKKYSRDQVANLVMVCFLKKIFSFSEIQRIVGLRYNSMEFADVYNKFCAFLEEALCARFGGRERSVPDNASETESILRSVTSSLADKIYVQKYLEERKGQD